MNLRQKSLLSTVISVALALLCYLLVLAISNDNQKSFDLTGDQRFSFSPQTESVMRELKFPVKLYVFADPQGDSSAIANLLDRYRRLNSNFSYEMVDLEKKPTLAESLQVRAYGQGVMERVEGDGKDGKDEKTPRRERLMVFDEASVTNALLKLATVDVRKVAFLSGHGERAIVGSGKETVSALVVALGSEGYVGETFRLEKGKSIPKDVVMVVLAGPTTPLLPGEESILDDYLQAGGKMLFMADISTPESYVTWLARYGFELKDSVIIDQDAQLANVEPTFAVGQEYSREHPVTRALAGYTGFRMSRPVGVAEAAAPLGEGGPPKLDVLAKTNKSAFAVSIATIRKNGQVTADPNDAAAYPLAAAGLYPRKAAAEAAATPSASATPADEPVEVSARIVVVGNTEAFTNSLFTFVSNRDFVLNTINWLADSENQITVRSKDPKSQPLMLEKQKESWMQFVFGLLIPVLLMLTGILVHFGRRRGLA